MLDRTSYYIIGTYLFHILGREDGLMYCLNGMNSLPGVEPNLWQSIGRGLGLGNQSMSPYEVVILSRSHGRYADSNIPGGPPTVNFTRPFATKSIEWHYGSRSMDRSLLSSARFELWRSQREFEEGIPILWPNFSGVQLQISRLLSPAFSRVFTFYFGTVEFHVKPVEQKYESKALKSPRSAGEQMNLVVIFFSNYWLVVNTRGFFYLRPGRELQRIGIPPWPRWWCCPQHLSLLHSVLSWRPITR